MPKRPLSIALVGWLFVATGGIVVVTSLVKLSNSAGSGGGAGPSAHELRDFAWAAGSGVLAAVGGAFTLRGHDWARWILVVWMVGHLALSLAHSVSQLLVHVAIFAPLLFLLFRRPASAYFRKASASA